MTDRLHLGLFGAYGWGSAETVAFDRLSFESTLFDQYYSNTLDLGELCRSLWTGVDPSEANAAQGESLPALFARAGYRTILVTDAPHTVFGEFETVDRIDFPTRSEPCATVEETRCFALFARVAEYALEAARENRPFFLWAHLAGFGIEWDFPDELRQLFIEDPEDPAPYSGTAVPYWELSPALTERGAKRSADSGAESHENAGDAEIPDFDRLRAVVETYAAGLSVWDRSLEELVGVLKTEKLLDTTLFLLGATRGFPLGEHSRIGVPPEDGAAVESAAAESIAAESVAAESVAKGVPPALLQAEELHLPLLIRFPRGNAEIEALTAAARSSVLCGPVEIYRLLCRYAQKGAALEGAVGAEIGSTVVSGGDVPTLLDAAMGRAASLRERLVLVERDALSALRGVVTDEWYLIHRPAGDDAGYSVELYVRPDDRWNVNNVAARCPDVARRDSRLALPRR